MEYSTCHCFPPLPRSPPENGESLFLHMYFYVISILFLVRGKILKARMLDTKG